MFKTVTYNNGFKTINFFADPDNIGMEVEVNGTLINETENYYIVEANKNTGHFRGKVFKVKKNTFPCGELVK